MKRRVAVFGGIVLLLGLIFYASVHQGRTVEAPELAPLLSKAIAKEQATMFVYRTNGGYAASDTDEGYKVGDTLKGAFSNPGSPPQKVTAVEVMPTATYTLRATPNEFSSRMRSIVAKNPLWKINDGFDFVDEPIRSATLTDQSGNISLEMQCDDLGWDGGSTMQVEVWDTAHSMSPSRYRMLKFLHLYRR